jgi:hypothetical protein
MEINEGVNKMSCTPLNVYYFISQHAKLCDSLLWRILQALIYMRELVCKIDLSIKAIRVENSSLDAVSIKQ